ncbi:response regulator transcription factor [Paenibacillus oceani]|uniref:Response regulator transcription factor n=1 Tax=Paenibacillus oceani TaxID=2772510 RepID=A0A927C5E9_9BACL|nr:response regulator transcription factor [Paenibacillus oceani]MBD2861689.1 response regulator transcription factor [Paenibacillus oceani]
MKLLVAEDDPSVCEMLRLFLEKEHIQAEYVHDGHEAEKLLRERNWDFVLLDWMLPGRDGLQLCAELRSRSDTPVILLTAKTAEKDRITGLELGADDYVTKPFSPLELIARMKAVLRRYKAAAAAPSPVPEVEAGPAAGAEPEDEPHDESRPIRYKELAIDTHTREVTIRGELVANLTPKEFELLLLFVKHPKKVFTREQLIENVWGIDYYGEDRTVDVHIKRLRDKIATKERLWVSTVWGIGYKLEE